jgi:hypothetical protein
VAVYNPPTRTTTLEMPFAALVARVDPNFNRDRYREVEYQFTKRVFVANPAIRGAYNDNDN